MPILFATSVLVDPTYKSHRTLPVQYYSPSTHSLVSRFTPSIASTHLHIHTSMASRLQRRVIFFSIALFLLIGVFVIEQRPTKHQHQSDLWDSLLNIVPSGWQMDSPVHGAVQNMPSSPEMAKKLKLEPDHELDSCTVSSVARGFMDLRPLSSLGNEGKAQPWVVKAHEDMRNYSIGVCSSPVRKSHLSSILFADNVNGSEVGAYFIDPKTQEYILMGQLNDKPVMKGRKIILNYENGSFCRNIVSTLGERLRRNTILTFVCDRETMTKAHISHVTSVQDCTYMFEIRSHFACPTAAKADNLAAIWIFFLILLAALLVYFSGTFVFKNLKRQSSKE